MRGGVLRTGGVPAGGDEQAADVVEAVGFVCLASLCVAAGFAFAWSTSGTSARRPSLKIEDTINPNEASLASLSRLPNVGLARAKEIVSFRNQLSGRAVDGPAFSHADDLEKVSGIGPATVEAIRPWLSFDPRPADRETPVGRQP